MLSIITVAKGRYSIFSEAIDSLWSLAYDPHSIEHIIAYDADDKNMETFLKQYQQKYHPYKIIIVAVELPLCAECNVVHYELRNLHRDYWNPIARGAKGDVILGMPNVAIIESKDFDRIILSEVARQRKSSAHSYFQILVDDSSLHNKEEYRRDEECNFCHYIILSKEAVSIFGGICPNEIVLEKGDLLVYNIFKNALNNDCQIDLRNKISIRNVSHHTEGVDVDHVTLSHPVERPVNLEELELSYGIKLDYLILKQKKWVKNEISKFNSNWKTLKNFIPVEGEGS